MIVKYRRNREPGAPTRIDEILSVVSLRSSPWVVQRIRELKIKGRLVKGWTPPVVTLYGDNLTRVSDCS